MHGTMQILDRTGHTELQWDPAKPVELEIARAAFDKYLAQGYSAFEVGRDGERGRRVDTFNPNAKKLMMVPQLVGG